MNASRTIAALAAALAVGAGAPIPGWAQIPAHAAPQLSQYLDSDRGAEIAVARSAAPPSISLNAAVLVLTSHGYESAAPGSNGFTCLVERSFMSPFENPQFWNPRFRAPVCYNAAASRSILPYTVFRTNMVLKGVPKDTMFDRIKSAVAARELPPLESGSMAYMMSKHQYLTDLDPATGITSTSWHPHVMFYAPIADAADSGAAFGANLKGSPVVFDPSGGTPEPWTVFFVPVSLWSDGSPAFAVNMHHGTDFEAPALRLRSLRELRSG